MGKTETSRLNFPARSAARRILVRKTACGRRAEALSCVVAGLTHHPKFHLRIIPSIASYLHEISSSAVTHVQDRAPTQRRPFPGSLQSGCSAGTAVGRGDRRAPIETQKDHACLQPPQDFALSLPPLLLEGTPFRLPQALSLGSPPPTANSPGR